MDQIGPTAPKVYQQQVNIITTKTAFLEFHLLASVCRPVSLHYSWTKLWELL